MSCTGRNVPKHALTFSYTGFVHCTFPLQIAVLLCSGTDLTPLLRLLPLHHLFVSSWYLQHPDN